ncbi:MAG: flagellar biosynthetic protein FliR [Thermogutta sp.]
MPALPILEKHLITFVLVFVRLSGTMTTAPLFSRKDIPAQVRIFLAVALAFLLAPLQVRANFPDPQTLVEFATLVAGEFLIGIVLGLGLMILLQGMGLAGELISRISGIGMNDIYDPTSESEVTGMSQFILTLGFVAFLCFSGERALIGGLLESYRELPIGATFASDDILAVSLTMLQVSFVLAVRVAAPAMAALLVVTLVLGLISRTLPQLNLLILGFGLNGLAAFGMVLLTLGITTGVFEHELLAALDRLFPWGFGL